MTETFLKMSKMSENNGTALQESCETKSSSACDVCGHRLTNVICSTAPEVWKLLDRVKMFESSIFKIEWLSIIEVN